MFEMHNAKKVLLGFWGGAPITHTTVPYRPVKVFLDTKQWCLGSGVAPQTPIPLYPKVQQRCFWIPRMVLFVIHNAIKPCLGSGVAP